MIIAGSILVVMVSFIGGLVVTTYLTTEGRGGALFVRLLPTPIVGTAGGWGFTQSGAYSYMVSAWNGSLGITGYLLWASIVALLLVWIFNLLATKEQGENLTLVR